MIEHSRIPELFCGFARQADYGPVSYPVACAPQSWASASVFMLLQAVLRLEIRASRRLIQFTRPKLPEFLREVTLRDLRVGEEVAGYRIRRVLGRGGSGTVYDAARSGEPAVALKVMHEHDPSGVGRKRFVREAALVQKLSHPHVVKLLDYGYTDAGLPFIAFALLVGRSLKSELRKRGGLGEDRVAGEMADPVVDRLEVVEVEEQQRGLDHPANDAFFTTRETRRTWRPPIDTSQSISL